MKRGNFPTATDKCESHRNVTVQVSVRVLRDSDGFSDDSRTDRLPGVSGVGATKSSNLQQPGPNERNPNFEILFLASLPFASRIYKTMSRKF
jgi:hypothetical protein